MPVTLTVTEGPHAGRVFTIDGHETFLVGRSPHAHLSLPEKDRYFSRVHFLLEANPPLCRIVDQGSRNGTHVNGNRIESADLKDGDIIKAGHTLIRVGIRDPDETLDAAPPPSATPRPARPPAPIPASSAGRCPACTAPLTGELLCPPCQQLAAAAEQFVPGHVLVRELGRGAMGTVWLGVRREGRSAVAVKTILPAVAGTPAAVQRFLREAEVLRQLDHPGIVSFRDMGEAGGQLWFAMDYVPGGDVKELLDRRGRLEVRLAVRLMCQVLEALSHAHARGYVHRDIKPSNLLLADDAGGKRRIKVADFGLAHVYQASRLSGLTATGVIGGTPRYMPPEQVTDYRNAAPAADQSSAAATLYHLLAGKPVHDLPAAPGMQFLKILHDDPIPLRDPSRRPEVPEELAATIHQALRREPGDRWPDVDAFRRALIPFAR